ncbi:peroxiredoxin family protein [Oceaniglobus trochenteri]|uniref:peroxiredoxin family protein n=1 Tax=Oceaniglobus trochenteri TaxID=2763260 RepID=UPI001CFF99F8|nr:redoxin domain-containing protein [Oceaniglobus trochenteri]
MQFGSIHQTAQELRVSHWIDGDGKQMKPLKLSDLGDDYKIIYSFQHWCPGCHSRGFPTLKLLHDRLADKGVGFAAIQTVFEGAEFNTPDKLRLNQEQYGLKIPFGHDLPQKGDRHPSFMEDYRTGGTPWFTVIDPAGQVVFADFRLDAARFLKAMDAETLDMNAA